MRIFPLNKKVYSVSGGAEKFLSGLTSNDLSQPNNAFCNLHGKIIATFEQIKVGDDEYWIVIAAQAAEELLQHLDKYIKLSKVTFAEKTDLHAYFDCDGDAPGQRVDHLVVSSEKLGASIGEEEFTLYRLKNNIPLHGVDYFADFLLNVDEHRFVSYEKGCFLGQEPISKVHSRSNPSWQLLVKAEDECSEEEKNKMTSKTKDPESGKVLGFVFVRRQKE